MRALGTEVSGGFQHCQLQVSVTCSSMLHAVHTTNLGNCMSDGRRRKLANQDRNTHSLSASIFSAVKCRLITRFKDIVSEGPTQSHGSVQGSYGCSQATLPSITQASVDSQLTSGLGRASTLSASLNSLAHLVPDATYLLSISTLDILP